MSTELDNSKQIHEDISSLEFMGIVVDVDDPLRIGRAKVRVFEKYDSLDIVDIPWAVPGYYSIFGHSSGSGNFSTPKVGTVVRVKFEVNIYTPVFYGPIELSSELRNALSEDYVNANVLIWDQDETLKVYYTQGQGLTLELKNSQIKIRPDSSILINHSESSSTIELIGDRINVVSDSQIEITSQTLINIISEIINVEGAAVNIGVDPTYSEVMGELLFDFLQQLATITDNKFPPSPGSTTSLVQQARELVLSKTVKTSL